MENEKYPYQKEWKSYRRLVKSPLVLIPTIIFLFVLLFVSPASIILNLLATVGILLFIALMIINLKITFWKCPRCRHLYFRWWQHTQMLFAKQCKNCGLGKYEGSSFTGFFSK